MRLAVLAALVLAFYGSGLSHTPPHLHHDEVIISLQAHSIATTGHDIEGRRMPLYFFMPHLGDRAWYQPTIIYVTALFLKFLPSVEASFRFPTAVLATLDVVLMFFVARRLFGSDRWGFVAAILLAMTPTHVILGRVAFDFIYPLPFILGWLWALLVYLDRRDTWRLFAATSVLGVGMFSYIASVAMMPLYLLLTLFVVLATGRLSAKTAGAAVGGFVWPLLFLVPWVIMEPTFVQDILHRYSLAGAQSPGFHVSAVSDRVTLYWSFFNPAFLFLMGGFTHLTASTRLVGVFLLPFAVLIPLGLIQMVTSVRTAMSVLIAAGFATAPLAAVLTVNEPYASSRQLAILVFGVLIAVYGVQRLLQWRGAGRLIAVALFVLLPVHFGFFVAHYFGAYHGYAAAQFEWNHKDALAAIIERNGVDHPQPVYLTATRDPRQWIDAFWRLALALHKREDLMSRTHYFDTTKSAVIDEIPPGAFVLASTDDKVLLDAVKSGEFSQILAAPEPADEPVLYVLQRKVRP